MSDDMRFDLEVDKGKWKVLDTPNNRLGVEELELQASEADIQSQKLRIKATRLRSQAEYYRARIEGWASSNNNKDEGGNKDGRAD